MTTKELIDALKTFKPTSTACAVFKDANGETVLDDIVDVSDNKGPQINLASFVENRKRTMKKPQFPNPGPVNYYNYADRAITIVQTVPPIAQPNELKVLFKDLLCKDADYQEWCRYEESKGK